MSLSMCGKVYQLIFKYTMNPKIIVSSAAIALLGFVVVGNVYAEGYQGPPITNYGTGTGTISTTANGQATSTITPGSNVFIIGLTGNPTGSSGDGQATSQVSSSGTGSVLGASTVGLPVTGEGGEAQATWTIIASFLAVLGLTGLLARRRA